jgi:hypothetical protein
VWLRLPPRSCARLLSLLSVLICRRRLSLPPLLLRRLCPP